MIFFFIFIYKCEMKIGNVIGVFDKMLREGGMGIER